MTDWFARPVLHVTDVETSLRPQVLPRKTLDAIHAPVTAKKAPASKERLGHPSD
jgi:hypothetical protein